MSVRRRLWRYPATGERRECWMVDVTVVGPDGVRRRERRVAPLQNKRAAERFEHELRQELLANGGLERTPPPPVPSFADFAVKFVETYARTNNKPSEVESKQAILRVHLLPAFGLQPLDQIGLRQIEDYKARKLTEGLARKTVNNHLAVLRRMLAIASEWGLVSAPPRVRWLDAPEPEFTFLSFEEAERLIAAADDRWRTMIVVAVRTGLRLGELLALRWCDADLDSGRIIVRRGVARGVVGTPKNGRSREVPLSEGAAQALRAEPRTAGELVFPTLEGGMLTKGACKWPLYRAAERAGLRRIGWHVLRHTFASHLVMRGAPLKAVQELLGHGTMEMTMRYAHLSPDARRDAVRLLDLPARPRDDEPV